MQLILLAHMEMNGVKWCDCYDLEFEDERKVAANAVVRMEKGSVAGTGRSRDTHQALL